MADRDRIEPRHRVSTTLVLSLAAVGAALVAIFGGHDGYTALTVGAALAGLVPWALVAGGIRVPPVVFAAISLVCAGFIVAVDLNPGGMFPVMLMVVWIARSSGSWWLNAAVVAIGAGLLVVATIRDGSAEETGLVYFLGGLGISWLTGQMLRRQESLTVELQAMNELRVEHAASSERARIAREVHDVVAHSLTIVMLHVSGARRAITTDPVRAEEALARAEAVGRESLASIRQVMGLLREPGVAASLPGLADVPALIDGYRTGGLAVDAVVDDMQGVDPTIGSVVYRVVQESLTNVLRHAAGAACALTIQSPDGQTVEIEIVNGPGRVSIGRHEARVGLGVRGMTERVRALGGRLDAGPTSDGGWRTWATIPRRGGLQQEATDPEVTWPQPTVR